MRIQEVLHTAYTLLKSRLESEILLAAVLRCDRAYLYTWPEKNISNENIEKFNKFVERRVQGEPVAYILEQKEFWSLPLKVSKDVLIPRPETELLVQLVLDKFPNTSLQILDLGTGSGAIALAIAKERPAWRVTAIDISNEALHIAKENARLLNINQMQWLQGNWFEALSSTDNIKDTQNKLYHVIVANPPYIAENDPHLLQGDLRFEPTTALTSLESGLQDIQTIISESPQYLYENGWLLLEHGATQAKDVRSFMKHNQFTDIKTYQDLAGNDRVTLGRKL